MNNFDRVEVLSWISDLYKDVNGVRPRFYNFNEWSDNELEIFTDQLIAQLKENEEKERLQEIADVKSFEIQVQKTIELGSWSSIFPINKDKVPYDEWWNNPDCVDIIQNWEAVKARKEQLNSYRRSK